MAAIATGPNTTAATTSGVKSTIGMAVSCSLPHHAEGVTMCHMVTLYRQIARQATILVVNPDKMSVPAKLRSRRVREFVLSVSRDLRAL